MKSEMQWEEITHRTQDADPKGPLLGVLGRSERSWERARERKEAGRTGVQLSGDGESYRRVQEPWSWGKGTIPEDWVSEQMDLRKGYGCGEQRGSPHTPGVCRRSKKGKGVTREEARETQLRLPGAPSLYPKVHNSAINSNIYK